MIYIFSSNISSYCTLQWTILNGRVFDAGTMNQIYPTAIERPTLYFENQNIDVIDTEEHLCGCGIH